jgi:hypothetical protein
MNLIRMVVHILLFVVGKIIFRQTIPAIGPSHSQRFYLNWQMFWLPFLTSFCKLFWTWKKAVAFSIFFNHEVHTHVPYQGCAVYLIHTTQQGPRRTLHGSLHLKRCDHSRTRAWFTYMLSVIPFTIFIDIQ